MVEVNRYQKCRRQLQFSVTKAKYRFVFCRFFFNLFIFFMKAVILRLVIWPSFHVRPGGGINQHFFHTKRLTQKDNFKNFELFLEASAHPISFPFFFLIPD